MFNNEITKAMETVAESSISKAGYDKTRVGQVVTVNSSGTYTVKVDNQTYPNVHVLNTAIKNDPGDLVKVVYPVNQPSQMYIDNGLMLDSRLQLNNNCEFNGTCTFNNETTFNETCRFMENNYYYGVNTFYDPTNFNNPTFFYGRPTITVSSNTGVPSVNDGLTIVHNFTSTNPGLIFFENVVSGQTYHRVGLFQGGSGGNQGLGIWDYKNARGVYYYDDINNLNVFYQDINITNGGIKIQKYGVTATIISENDSYVHMRQNSPNGWAFYGNLEFVVGGVLGAIYPANTMYCKHNGGYYLKSSNGTNVIGVDIQNNVVRTGLASVITGAYTYCGAAANGSWRVYAGGTEVAGSAVDSTSRYVRFPTAYNRTYGTTANMVITSAGTIGRHSSCRRLKENFTKNYDPENNPENLYKLPVRQYNYKAEYIAEDDDWGTKPMIGFIAEEVGTLFKCGAVRDEEGQVIDWSAFTIVPAMLKLIQDQKKELDEIRSILAKHDIL